MTKPLNRRKFISTAGAIGAGFGVWTSSQPAVARPSALQGLAGACIGVGGKGSSDSSHIAEQGVSLVGLCDVDGRTLTKKAREFPDAAKFSDYREMLDQLGDKIDLVSISTTDHTHAAMAVKAMRMKKHVYCQKPLTWSIAEARLLQEVAEETGVVTQCGNQGTAGDGLREAVEVLRSGAIGDVTEVHVWTNRPVWPQGTGRPAGEDPIPDQLNWDVWIGPAQMRPFKEGVYHAFNWRGWCDFGTGALGDMACHTTNMPIMALELFDAEAVTPIANSGIVEGETYPATTSLLFEFAARKNFPACKFHWYDGGELPPKNIIQQLPKSFQKRVAEQLAGATGPDGKPKPKTSGAVVVGSKGIMFSPDDYGAKYSLLPKEEFVDYQPPEQTLPRIPFKGLDDQRQKWEFVSSIKGEYEPGTMSHFGYSGRLTETILVGNLALRAPVGKRIEWDAKSMTSPNVPEVNQFVRREYRNGWDL